MNNFLLTTKKVLYVCMETTVGGRNYSGGLGALCGDTIRTMHRLGASFICVTPLYKNGYVQQTIDANGVHDEFPAQDFSDYYKDTGIVLSVPMAGRDIKVKVWQHKKFDNAYGLDTSLPENDEFAYITNNLYGEYGFGGYDGEQQRLMQEVILGIGAVKLCRNEEIGFNFDILHLNEGHGVFSALYMISEFMHDGMRFAEAKNKVRGMTTFTTHTPIGAGNKSRPIKMILDLGVNCGLDYDQLCDVGGDDTRTQFGSTICALRLSKIANAVAMRHQATSHELWKGVKGSCNITYIDNGVDIPNWQDPDIKTAFDNYSYYGLLKAHKACKLRLIEEVKRRNGVELDKNSIIIGFARRFIGYKRADLIFEDIARFEVLIARHNLQIIFSGKAHPKDFGGKGILQKIYDMTQKYPNNVVLLQNYDADIARFMVQGSDVWLGNPEIPLEACSTSGMKAAANGVINLSTADGWWYKSARYGVNGWIIGESTSHDKYTDAMHLYKALEEKVLPAYNDETIWSHMMLASIYTANEECSTDRMCRDYYAYLYNAPFLG